MPDKSLPLLEVRNLSKTYTLKFGSWFGKDSDRKLKAVDDVSLQIMPGQSSASSAKAAAGRQRSAR